MFGHVIVLNMYIRKQHFCSFAGLPFGVDMVKKRSKLLTYRGNLIKC